MATYSDMVTLLLTFFVMLMGMANFEDTVKVEAVMESIRAALGVHGFDEALVGTARQEAFTEDSPREEAVHALVARLRQAMESHVSDELVKITTDREEVRLRLDDRVFFGPNSTTLHPSSYALLADLAAIVGEHEAELVVEGHSDASGDEQKNWELSALRAVAVVRAVQARGPVDGQRLTAAAFGSHRPASTFAGDESWNRRIEFVIRTDDVAAAAAARTLEEEARHGR
jgi:chemotaxis protein MotB